MKKYFIGLFIMGMAISVYSFTNHEKKDKHVTENWYEYRSTSQDPGDLLDESKYFKVDAPSGCNSNENICAIFVPGTGDHPDSFSQTIEGDLLNAVDDELPVTGYIEMKHL